MDAAYRISKVSQRHFITERSVEREASGIPPTLQGGKLSPTRVRGTCLRSLSKELAGFVHLWTKKEKKQVRTAKVLSLLHMGTVASSDWGSPARD